MKKQVLFGLFLLATGPLAAASGEPALHCRTVHFANGGDFHGCRPGEFERPSIQAGRTFCCHYEKSATMSEELGEPVVLDEAEDAVGTPVTDSE